MPQWLVVDVTLHWVWANNPREPPSRRKKKKKVIEVIPIKIGKRERGSEMEREGKQKVAG